MTLLADILHSALRLPRWVLFWVCLVLVPVNLASLFLIAQPGGIVVATLAVGGMVPNIFIMASERGLSRLMALPHLIIWTPLAVLLTCRLLSRDLDPGWPVLLAATILIVDSVSLCFDYPDFYRWLKGERRIA